ncbi:MAG: quinohemoprotein amine dehydrogenase maturation protein [Phycisphaeraceae bacterium]|nr:quinohemoprotein amine dehydrogenase maturation protein [Phycisphaeraceae bacterium]
MKLRAALHRRVEVDGVPYVYVTPSAAVLRLDDVSTEILDAFTSDDGAEVATWAGRHAQADEFADRKVTLDEMVAIGLIRPADEVAPPASKVPPTPFPLATLVLNVTNKCNLSCTYCYEYGDDRIASSARTDGTPKASMMSSETATQSVDFLFEKARDRRDVTITFFGGETLLNFGTIEAAVHHAEARAAAEGKKVGFSLTTNATLLTDEVIAFLVDHRFGVNVSVDGAKEAHDRHRTFTSGKGSYDVIVPRLQAFIEKNRAAGGRAIGARVTLTAGMTRVREVYRHLHDELGFDEVGFAPVTSAPGNDYALSNQNYWEILDEFAALAEDFVAAAKAGKAHGFSNLNDVLRELHQGINKAHPCGAGLGLLGVSTEGELGLCHRFVESGAHEIGNVATGLDESKRRAFLETGHISTKVACHSCFARPLCSGGCYHEAYVRYGDANQPNLHYCEWIRAWTDLGLRTYARVMNANPAYMNRFGASAPPPPHVSPSPTALESSP